MDSRQRYYLWMLGRVWSHLTPRQKRKIERGSTLVLELIELLLDSPNDTDQKEDNKND